MISWAHGRGDVPHLAVSFIWDGTFFRAWDFLSEAFPDLGPILDLPTAANLQGLLETISPKVPPNAEVSNTMELYRRVYSSSTSPNRRNRHIEALFQVYRSAHTSGEAHLCRVVAKFFKRLISIGQIPDITLNLISDVHYQDFFQCLSFLEENADISLGYRRYFSEHSRFNNYLGIDNPEILENINNNFRITFLKDFIFPTFLTDRQLEELNTFLFLHNNTIVCHINTIMESKMGALDERIERDPGASHDFFTELFSIFKVTLQGLKATFIQRFIDLGLHVKVVCLMGKVVQQLLETTPQRNQPGRSFKPTNKSEVIPHSRGDVWFDSGDMAEGMARPPATTGDRSFGDSNGLLEVSVESIPYSSTCEVPKVDTRRILTVCLEIIAFLAKNSQKAFLKVLQLEPPGNPTFLKILANLLRVTNTCFYKELLELFLSQMGTKVEDSDPQMQQFIAQKVIPFFAELVMPEPEGQSPDLNSARKTLYFVVELFNIFYQYHLPEVSQALADNCILNPVCDLLGKTKNKSLCLILLKYLKEALAKDDPTNSKADWKKAFKSLWGCYTRHARRRTNQLHSLALNIFKHVSKSDNFRLLRQFVKVARKNPNFLQSEDILEEIVAKFEDMKLKLKGDGLELTSESESSLTQDKLNYRKSEAFLEKEEPFRSPVESGKSGKERARFSTPKGMQDLISSLERRSRATQDEIDIVTVQKERRDLARQVKITFDENLLGKRQSLDPN